MNYDAAIKILVLKTTWQSVKNVCDFISQKEQHIKLYVYYRVPGGLAG